MEFHSFPLPFFVVLHPPTERNSNHNPPDKPNQTNEPTSRPRSGGRSRWRRLFICGSRAPDGDSPDAEGKFTPLAYLLFVALIVLAVLLALAHFRLFGLSISCK